ncbi:acyltransferase family protein [Erwinia piriflorinigrans]|uniref:Putative O-acetyltransferase n=1 Tax=Erwinia piriflorinigrans CFBP 5888 TaxID=1161919 RepID=V5ZAQ5_9GAMM|nr:acyltransferase [Erwinia piriflorinigrans]CCG88345.1 putative O-acetyltransferase [Erwinia piriflorinigrans CFBP 5888]
MTASRGWSKELEGLRGIASLWVLLGHISLLVNFHIKLISSPGIGVDLFILLSGYLMAKNYIERKDREPWNEAETIRKFWIRRFFRIAPLYYTLLAVAICFGPWLGEMRDVISLYSPGSATEASRYSDQSLSNIFTHVTFIFGLLPEYGFNTALPDWSIGLEMQFYMLFPFIMLIAGRFGYARSLLAIMLLCIIGKFVFRDYYEAFKMPSLILIKLNIFLSGMLLAEAVRRKSMLYILLALAGPVASVFIAAEVMKLQIVMEVLMILFMALILWQHSKGSKMESLIFWPRKVLNNRFSAWLGDVSYSVYLLHLLIVIPAIALLLTHWNLNEHSPVIRFSIVAAVVIPPIYLLSTVLYHFIEKSGIRLGKSILSTRNSQVETSKT